MKPDPEDIEDTPIDKQTSFQESKQRESKWNQELITFCANCRNFPVELSGDVCSATCYEAFYGDLHADDDYEERLQKSECLNCGRAMPSWILDDTCSQSCYNEYYHPDDHPLRNPDTNLRQLESNWEESQDLPDYIIYKNAANRAGKFDLKENIGQAIVIWLTKQISPWWIGGVTNDSRQGRFNLTFWKGRSSYPENVPVGKISIEFGTLQFNHFHPAFAWTQSYLEPLPQIDIKFNLSNLNEGEKNPLELEEVYNFILQLNRLKEMLNCKIRGIWTHQFYRIGPKTNGSWTQVTFAFWSDEISKFTFQPSGGFGVFGRRGSLPGEAGFVKKIEKLVFAICSELEILGWYRTSEEIPFNPYELNYWI